MSKTVGVLGGMGPYATADYFRKVLELTNAASDQEHIHLIIDDNTEIPDRSNYIMGTGEDPSKELIATATRLQQSGADILVMPCNTAHFFYKKIKNAIDIPFINMIEEVTLNIRDKFGEGAKVGLLATVGTYTGRMYDEAFALHNMNLINPDENGKQYVYKYIYNIKQGNLEMGIDKVCEVINKMREQGAAAIILGCTELPLIVDKLPDTIAYIDSTWILACKTVQYALKGE